ncbi:MAG: membrane lipoprotein lipid attachment site-containing protein [Lachnospiraceae bacterium]|nr:membrane lipoprotein lipid attachment site-containing protein [Lachnospiraceae bacterium]
MKKIIFVILICFVLTGCGNNTDLRNNLKQGEEYTVRDLLLSSFDADLCGALDLDETVYQVVITRPVDIYVNDACLCLDAFESGEKDVKNKITVLYITYMGSHNMPAWCRVVYRDKVGDHFDARPFDE